MAKPLKSYFQLFRYEKRRAAMGGNFIAASDSVAAQERPGGS
ncbi:MAG: hypothetical protein ACU84H_14020 [Gammaproteobacteria bacterium]